MCKVIIDVLIIYILCNYILTKIEIKAKPDKKTRDFNTTSNNKRKIVSTVAREQKFGQFGITINPLDI